MKIDISMDTVLDVLGTAAAAYAAYALTGGTPIPLFKDVVPWIAAIAFGIFAWRQFRKNNAA